MNEPENTEEVFEPIEIALDPPAGEVTTVSVTRIDTAGGYYVFRAVDADGREVGGTPARTAPAATEATAKNAEADIRSAL